MKFDRIGVLCLGALLSSGVFAAELWWQITADTGKTFDYAKLYVTDGATATQLEEVASDGESPSAVALHSTDIGTYNTSSYSFYVEMFNSSNVSVGKGATWNYNDLSKYVGTSFMNTTTAMTEASKFNMGSVPEPTSGLLLLMGGAVLALRRRRRV